MPRFDLSLPELEAYRPDVREPADFDAFWDETLAASRAAGGEVEMTRVATPLTSFDVFDLTFPGFAGEPIKAWFMVPAGAEEPLPAVVEYVGYGGGRGLPSERLPWPSTGRAYLIMDTRGQGSTWSRGDTPPPPRGPPPPPRRRPKGGGPPPGV